MNCIEIDLETRSDRDITKCGVYAYADSPYFAITLMSISVDGGEVQQYDFTAGDTVPEDILRALVDETVIKRAHNVNFERICLSKYLRENACTAVYACGCRCCAETRTAENAGRQGAHQILLRPICRRY